MRQPGCRAERRMKPLLKTLFANTLLAAVLGCLPAAAAPVDVIFDTDMGNDVDDVLALGLLHAL